MHNESKEVAIAGSLLCHTPHRPTNWNCQLKQRTPCRGNVTKLTVIASQWSRWRGDPLAFPITLGDCHAPSGLAMTGFFLNLMTLPVGEGQ